MPTLETRVFACPVCGALDDQLGPGPGKRPRASCRQCGSLERHRFLALLLDAFAGKARAARVVLDVAPSLQLSGLIRSLNPGGYVGIDFDPHADGRIVDVVASLTDLPFDDSSVGLAVCYHVLEHIPDDAAAMGQLARVLSKDGVALVQVPWRAGPTDEDPTATVAERIRRFGQADHVRYYGDDFTTRLEAAGLHVTAIRPRDLLDEDVMRVTGIDPDERVWVCSVSDGEVLDLGAVRAAVLSGFAPLLVKVAGRAIAGRSGSASGPQGHLATAVTRFRATAPGKAVATLTRPIRRRGRR